MTDPGKEMEKPHAAPSGMKLSRPAATAPKRNRLAGTLVILFLLLMLAGLVIWAINCRQLLWGGVCYYADLFTDKEWIQSILKAAGPLAPVIFIGIQILQVVFAPIPGEATGFIGGFLFGVPLGLLYSTIGLTVGSVLAFAIARWLEKHYVARWIPPEIIKKFDFLMERQGALISFFLFIFPGFPKDYLCFILGLSTMSWRLFLFMVIVGRLPGTLMLTLQGAQVYKGNYYLTAILMIICLALAGVMYWYREPLYHWMRRLDHHPEEGALEKK